MEESKLFWIKLRDNFFSDLPLKKLRKIAGGDTYTIIYLKLQLLSLKTDGKLFFEGAGDDLIDELSIALDEDIENVRFAIGYFEKCGMIEYISSDEIFMTDVPKNTGKEGKSAGRVREYRERAKLKDNVKTLQCNTDVTKCNTEIEIDIELEKDLDLEKEKDIEKEIKKDKVKKATYGEYKHVKLLEEEFNRLEEENGLEITLKAITILDEYMEISGKPYKNCNLVLRKWPIDQAKGKTQQYGKPKEEVDLYAGLRAKYGQEE